MKSKKSWNYTEAGRIVHILPRNNSGPVPAKGTKQTDPWPIFFNVEELQRSFFSFSRKKGLLAVSSEANSRTGTQKGNRKKRHTFWHVVGAMHSQLIVWPRLLCKVEKGAYSKKWWFHTEAAWIVHIPPREKPGSKPPRGAPENRQNTHCLL